MARIKAIFDADILIHLIKTESIEIALETLECILISEYVYEHEIKKNTVEGKKIGKLKNKGQVKILKYSDLTSIQKKIYRDAYNLLKKEDLTEEPEKNPINEGERVTAAMAKAKNIYYYMSDDNKAASFIKSLTAVDIVNYCDILFLHAFAFGSEKVEILKRSYGAYIDLYDEDKKPRVIKSKGKVYSFEEIIKVTYSKFEKTQNLMNLARNIKQNVQAKKEAVVDKLKD